MEANWKRLWIVREIEGGWWVVGGGRWSMGDSVEAELEMETEHPEPASHLHSVVLLIAHVNEAECIGCYAPRIIEFAICGALRTEGAQESSLGIEHLYAMIVSVKEKTKRRLSVTKNHFISYYTFDILFPSFKCRLNKYRFFLKKMSRFLFLIRSLRIWVKFINLPTDILIYSSNRNRNDSEVSFGLKVPLPIYRAIESTDSRLIASRNEERSYYGFPKIK